MVQVQCETCCSGVKEKNEWKCYKSLRRFAANDEDTDTSLSELEERLRELAMAMAKTNTCPWFE